MVRVISGVQLKDRKRSAHLTLMLCLNENIDQSAMETVFVGKVMCSGGRMVMS